MKTKLILLTSLLMILSACSVEPSKVSHGSAEEFVKQVTYKEDPNNPGVCYAFFGASQISSEGSVRQFVSVTYVPCEKLSQKVVSSTNTQAINKSVVNSKVNSNNNAGVK